MKLFWVALVLATSPVTSAAQSADAPEAELANVHAQLYALFESGVDQNAIHDGMAASMKDLFLQDPDFQLIESAYPGATDRIVASIRPVLVEYSERVRIEYRPRMIDALRSELSDAETREIITFYSSPIGRRVLALSSASYRPDSVLSTLKEDRATTSDDVKEDLNRTAAAAIGSMTKAEQQEFVMAIISNPALAKLQNVMPKITALRAKMEEEPMSSSEEKRLEATMEKAIARIMAEAGE